MTSKQSFENVAFGNYTDKFIVCRKNRKLIDMAGYHPRKCTHDVR